LDKNRELAYKLHRDIDKHVSSLSAKSEENKALSTRVVTLEKDVIDVGAKLEELSFDLVF